MPSRAAYAPPLVGPTPAPPATQERLASLADLARLLDRGVLNEAEFMALKRRLLGG
ncbi:MAG: SHOCT domain-containing protein [Gemmatimonadetes bacterium]|nr:SHOCT domain-containing protein [Gemmatimonadota bacterium]MBK7786224.1 SHOCT domain-containing protein [Gemmatimonadota bacterium]